MQVTYSIRIGTINELTGCGEEWLVDAETRQYVLAKFFNGNFIVANNSNSLSHSDGPTLVMDDSVGSSYPNPQAA